MKLWPCTKCGLTKPIAYGWNNRFQPERACLCTTCNAIRKREEAKTRITVSPKPRKPIAKQSEKQKAKNAKTRAFNARIWATRPHVCFETGQPLGDKSRGIFFSHVHSKGAREDLRFNESNVVLHCPSAHQQWESGDRSTMPKTMERFKELNTLG